MNVSLTPKLEAWVQAKVTTGLYTSSSEVVREALRIMSAYESERSRRMESLRADVLIGLEQAVQGESVPFTKLEVERIKEEARNNRE